MASPRPVPGLDAAEPFGAAAGRVLTVRADELWTMAERVRREASPDAIHDMRVATRRLRAALEVFARCFPGRAHKAVLKDVKALADALGERRDPDVLLGLLTSLEPALGNAEAAGVTALAERFAADRAAGGETVSAALTAARDSDLHGRIEVLVRSVRT